MLTFVKDLGMRQQGSRNRRFSLVTCSYCGKTVEMRADIAKRSQSCGCLKAIKASKTALGLRTHKLSKTRLYGIWLNMKNRCRNKNDKSYPRYGGRGITVCDEWTADFMNFYNWAQANGYDETKTIDRINNDAGYSPENCRWTDAKQQARNRRSNLAVEYEGKTMTLVEVSELTGIEYGTLSRRFQSGDRGERLVRPLNADKKTQRGEKNFKAVITAEIAKDIKLALAHGETCLSIANRHNVTKYLVHDIKQNRTWKHITIDNTEVTDGIAKGSSAP